MATFLKIGPHVINADTIKSLYLDDDGSVHMIVDIVRKNGIPCGHNPEPGTLLSVEGDQAKNVRAYFLGNSVHARDESGAGFPQTIDLTPGLPKRIREASPAGLL